MMPSHTVMALLQDHPDALRRAVGVFQCRGLNIRSIHVEPTARTGFSELTCVVEGESIDGVTRSLSKLIEVVEVHEVNYSQADGAP